MKTFRNIVVFLILFAGTSCDKFDDINTNPDAATDVSSSLLATPMILNLLTTVDGASGFIAGNCLAKQMVWMEALDGYNYNVLGRTSFADYKTIFNVVKMVEAAEPDKKDAYQALALFLKAYKLFYHTMMVGDIPYSEALAGDIGIIKPKYDTQEEVVQAVLDDLEKASGLFAVAKNFEGDPSLYSGNALLWKKATDAFRLKVLLYLSKKENHPGLKVKEQFNSIVQGGSLFASNAENLQTVFSNKAGQIYPFNRSVSSHYYYCTVSSVIIDTLKAYGDYRLYYFAQPAQPLLDKGIAQNDPDAFVGLDPTVDFGQLQSQYADGYFAAMNLRYTDHVTGEPYARLGYAEQNFILAEAVLRGWISGDAESYYNKGIEASMKFITDHTPDDPKYNYGMKITDDYIRSYLASDKVRLKGSFDDKLKQIICQKFLTYYIQYPYDAYYEYRRTGYPELPINPDTNRNTKKDRIPVRWMYPTWEFDYNKEHLEAAVTRQYNGLDDENELMWILK